MLKFEFNAKLAFLVAFESCVCFSKNHCSFFITYFNNFQQAHCIMHIYDMYIFCFFCSLFFFLSYLERVADPDPVEPVPCQPWSSRASKMTQPNLDYMGNINQLIKFKYHYQFFFLFFIVFVTVEQIFPLKYMHSHSSAEYFFRVPRVFFGRFYSIEL